MHSLWCMCRSRLHARKCSRLCTLSLSDIDPALILLLHSNCTRILAATEISSTRGKKSRKYGMYISTTEMSGPVYPLTAALCLV